MNFLMKQRSFIFEGLFALFCCLLFGWGAHAMEPRGSEQKAYWYDATGRATLDEAQKSVYTSYTGILTQGYLPGATWLKLHVKGVASESASQKFVLWIRPTYLDSVTLFDPALAVEPRFTGDGVPKPSYLGRPTSLGFRLPTQEYDREVYLRVESTSTHLIEARLMTADQFLDAESFEAFWQGIFFGVMGLILLWALLAWMDNRDHLLGLFFLKHFMVLLYSVGYLGYFGYVLEPGHRIFNPDIAFSFTIFAVVTTNLKFQIGLLAEYGMRGWRIGIFRLVYLAPAIAIALVIVHRMQFALELMALVTAITSVVLFLVVLITPVKRLSRLVRPDIDPAAVASNSIIDRHRQSDHGELARPLSKPMLLAYYGVTVLLLLPTASQTLGWYQGDMIVLYGYLFQSFISSILVIVLLMVRTRVTRRQQNEVARQMARAQGELTAQRLAQEDQGRMVEMLGHEIKTPLSVLQFAIDEWVADAKEREKLSESIDQIRTVTERSVDTIRQSLTQTEFQRVDLVALIDQQVNKTMSPERFTFRMPDTAVIFGDPLVVEQILGNLVDNSLKYGDLSSPIVISVALSQQVRLGQYYTGFETTISNQIGRAGSPAAEQVFKKYYRADSAKSQPGSGLGLYLVQAFTRFLNGEIVYRVRDNRVEFVVWLPVKKFS